jgi:hypothetical protein
MGPDIGAPFATRRAGEARLNVREPDIIWPVIRRHGHQMRASVVSAVDQDACSAAVRSHLAEGDFCWRIKPKIARPRRVGKPLPIAGGRAGHTTVGGDNEFPGQNLVLLHPSLVAKRRDIHEQEQAKCAFVPSSSPHDGSRSSSFTPRALVRHATSSPLASPRCAQGCPLSSSSRSTPRRAAPDLCSLKDWRCRGFPACHRPPISWPFGRRQTVNAFRITAPSSRCWMCR